MQRQRTDSERRREELDRLFGAVRKKEAEEAFGFPLSSIRGVVKEAVAEALQDDREKEGVCMPP